MFNQFLNYLAISVSTVEPVKNTTDEKQKAIWIVALVAIIAVCIVISRLKIDISGKLKEKKATNEKKKREEIRDKELERLHEIKRKNKRK